MAENYPSANTAPILAKPTPKPLPYWFNGEPLPETFECARCHQKLPIKKFDRRKIIRAITERRLVWCRRCCALIPKARHKKLCKKLARMESRAAGDPTPKILARIELFRRRIAKIEGEPRARSAKRRAAERKAAPSWVDWKAILLVYEECVKRARKTGVPHHVDHIVPLQGKTVCGLHVHWNLQVITAEENLSKSNKLLV